MKSAPLENEYVLFAPVISSLTTGCSILALASRWSEEAEIIRRGLNDLS